MKVKIYCKDCHKFIEEIKYSKGNYKRFCEKCKWKREKAYSKSPKGRATAKRYYWKHKEEILKRSKKWRKENRKKWNKYAREWYKKNKERITFKDKLRTRIWHSLSTRKQLKMMSKLCKKYLSRNYKTHNTTI